MTSRLEELADRVEKLTGPCRETDADIAATLRIGKPTHEEWVRKNFPVWRGRSNGSVEVVHTDGTGGVHWMSERYTASLDAAMALVPEDMYWHVGHGRTRDDEPLGGASIIEPFTLKTFAEAEAVTAALALTAASLRARAASESSHGG